MGVSHLIVVLARRNKIILESEVVITILRFGDPIAFDSTRVIVSPGHDIAVGFLFFFRVVVVQRSTCVVVGVSVVSLSVKARARRVSHPILNSMLFDLSVQYGFSSKSPKAKRFERLLRQLESDGSLSLMESAYVFIPWILLVGGL